MSRITRSTTVPTRSGSMSRTLHKTLIMQNQQPASHLAVSRISTERGRAYEQREQFRRNLMLHAGCLLLSVPNLSTEDRQFLYDLRRAEGRVTGIPFQLYELTQRSLNRVHREQLGKMLGCESDGRAVDLYAARQAESESNSPFDIAVDRFRQFPTRVNQEIAVRLGNEQIAATATLVDSIKAQRVN